MTDIELAREIAADTLGNAGFYSRADVVREGYADTDLCVQAALAALAAGAERERTAGWRDIASAPKDGTEILVCVTHSLGDGEWQTIQWVDWQRGDQVWPHYRERIDIPFPPTHWRPLPAPPAPETPSDAQAGKEAGDA